MCKSLPIQGCAQCFHSKRQIGFVDRCTHPDVVQLDYQDRMINTFEPFPYWCPLEDNVMGENNAKHTPGPWLITQMPWSNSRTIRHDGVTVAQLNGQTYPLQVNENALLIAAAPDLLDALTDARGAIESLSVDALGNGPGGEPAWYFRDELIDKISHAINKARGEE